MRMDPACSGKLIEILPPAVFKALLTEHLSRDLELTPKSVLHFCTRHKILPDTSYVDFVRRELPRRALQAVHAYGEPAPVPCTRGQGLIGNDLIGYANRFSQFYFGKQYGLRLPSFETLSSVPTSTAIAARDVIAFALAAALDRSDPAAVKQQIRNWLESQDSAPDVYPFLRKLFGQVDGPNVTTMLAMLPRDYLEMTHLILCGMTGTLRTVDSIPEADVGRRAA
jgi:hypothetical protein